MKMHRTTTTVLLHILPHCYRVKRAQLVLTETVAMLASMVKTGLLDRPDRQAQKVRRVRMARWAKKECGAMEANPGRTPPIARVQRRMTDTLTRSVLTGTSDIVIRSLVAWLTFQRACT